MKVVGFGWTYVLADNTLAPFVLNRTSLKLPATLVSNGWDAFHI